MKPPEVAAPEESRGNPHEMAATAGPGESASQMPGPQEADDESFTYHHASYEPDQHWFSAEHDGDEVGHAYVIGRQGPGGPYVEVKELWANPQYRGWGVGSQLLDNVGEHFKGLELRLKPYPIDEDSGQDEAALREFYSNRGFEDYQLSEGDPFELYDYMTKRAPSGPADVAPQHAAGAAAPALAALDFPAGSGPGRPGSLATSQPEGPGIALARAARRPGQQAPRRARGR
jgi:GNAT superfamily N-acetyltransferase